MKRVINFELNSDPDPEEISTALTTSTTINSNNNETIAEDSISQYNTSLNSQSSFDR